MSFEDPGSNPAEVTLWAFVSYDHVAGEHRVVGVQTAPAYLICSENPSTPAEWSVHSVDGGVPVGMFAVAWNSALATLGSVALNFLPGLNADAFVNNSTVTLRITVPNTGGDGTFAEVHDLTVHLRALSGRELVSLDVGGTALLGSGGSALGGALAASGHPNSTAFGTLPVWDELHWSSATPGATFDPDSNTLSSQVGVAGVAGSAVQLQLAPTASPASTDVRALFDGSSTVVFPGSSKTFNCGQSDLRIVESSGGPDVAIRGLPSEEDVAVDTDAQLQFEVEVVDATYFSLEDVSISVEFTRREGGSTVARYTHSGEVLAEDVAPPTGASVTIQQPTIASVDRPSIDATHPSWANQGLYAEAAHSAARASWGETTELMVQAGSEYSSVTVAVEAMNHAGETTIETSTVDLLGPSTGEGGAGGEGGQPSEPDGTGGDDDAGMQPSGGASGRPKGGIGGDAPEGPASSDGSESSGSDDSSGCGCRVGPASPQGSLWLAGPGALLWLRHRRPVARARAWWVQAMGRNR